MSNKKYVYSIMALAILTTLTTVTPALADNTTTSTTPNNAWGGRMMGNRGIGGMIRPAVFGTVSAVSGNIITVTSTNRKSPNNTTTATTTTYTVDATSAKIIKNNTAGTIASIMVGDTIMAQGTLTGTNLVATNIRDGVMMRGNGADNGKIGNSGNKEQGLSAIVGNGQPVVAGAIGAINGNTLTITNKSNVTYTIDATNAKITKEGNATASISNLIVGDMVVVQGTVNGNAIVASSVLDQAKVASTTTGVQHKGFFGSIGSFFSHLFGY